MLTLVCSFFKKTFPPLHFADCLAQYTTVLSPLKRQALFSDQHVLLLIDAQRTTIHTLKRYTSFVELDVALRRTLPVCYSSLFPSLAYFDSFSDISCSQFRHFPLKILFPASALLSLIVVVDYYSIGWLTFYFIPKLAVSTS